VPLGPLQHSIGHLDCPACQGVKLSTMFGESLAHLLFPAAARLWLDGRRKLSKSSRRYYLDYIAALASFFGTMPLEEIHLGNIVTYQKDRQAQIRITKRHRATNPAGAENEWDGASLINHELSCLQQIMTRAGLWAEIAKFYEPLPLPKEGPGIALEPEEERHWFQVAKAGGTRWEIAYWCSLLSRGTTAGPGEIRHLRLKDIVLDPPEGPVIKVLRHTDGGAKNEFRERPLPLNLDAEKAVCWLLDRARDLGACAPEHYLLPHRADRKGDVADPTRPMGSWKRAHEAICQEAGKKYPRLLGLRPYDFRHTAATDLMEDPTVSWATIEHLLGHRINSKTKRKYDHIRNQKLRDAATALHRGHEIAIATAAPAVERRAPTGGRG
jgi:integrase